MQRKFIDFIDDCELPASCNVMPTELISDVRNFQSIQECPYYLGKVLDLIGKPSIEKRWQSMGLGHI